MSLRKQLVKPFVVEATKDATCTVIFLHRFPQDTPQEQLPAKVLSAKLTKNHKTLAEQFPSVRWVFPYPKLHAEGTSQQRLRNQHWSGLTAQEIADLELPFGSDLPYITQIILQEAKRAGGLDRIILGGQGETAIAAHDARSAFPELAAHYRQSESVEQGFIDRFFVGSGWTKLEQLRMGGFVGMHAQDGPATRDESDYLLSRRTSSSRIVNHTILKQTPHKFIRGGYKPQTATWDGPRIDTFAWFLVSLGVAHEGLDIEAPRPEPQLRQAVAKKEPENTKPGMTPQQRHALEVAEDKKADQEARRRILMQIEEDKRERRRRKERQREARQYAAGEDTDTADSGDVPEPRVKPQAFQTQTQTPQSSAAIIRQYEQRPMPWEAWAAMPDELRGEGEWEPRPRQDMSEAQLKALGIKKGSR